MMAHYLVEEGAELILSDIAVEEVGGSGSDLAELTYRREERREEERTGEAEREVEIFSVPSGVW